MDIGGYGRNLLMFQQLEHRGVIKLYVKESPDKLMLKLTGKGKHLKTKGILNRKNPSRITAIALRKAKKGKTVAVKGKDVKTMAEQIGKVKIDSESKVDKLQRNRRTKKSSKKSRGKMMDKIEDIQSNSK